MNIFIYEIIFIYYTNSKYIAFQFEDDDYYAKLNLGIGNYAIYHTFYVNLENSCNIINNAMSSSHDVDTNITFRFYDESFNCDLKYDIMVSYDDQYRLDRFYYYFVYGLPRFFNQIGMGYSIVDKRLSIVYEAYEANLIDHLAFGISNKNNSKRVSYLYLGTIPNNIKKHNYKGFCFVQKNHSTWGCNLNYIRFNNSIFKVNHYAYFTLLYNHITTTEEFFSFLNMSLYNKFNTKLEMPNNNTYLFKLNQNYAEKMFPPIYFGFNGYEIWLREELFSDLEINTQMYSLNLKFRKTKNIWTFGSCILQKYTMWFDYQTSEIFFYGDLISDNTNSLITIIFFYKIIFILYSIGIIIQIKNIIFKPIHS